MANLLNPTSCVAAALLTTLTIASAQTSPPVPAGAPAAALPTAPITPGAVKSSDNLLVVQSAPAAAGPAAKPAPATGTAAITTTTTTEQDAVLESGGVGVR